MKEKLILGIDPGTNIMGYGLLRINGNKATLENMGAWDMRKINDPYLRLGRIFEQVTDIICKYPPDEMAIEAPFSVKRTIHAKARTLSRSCHCCSNTS